MFGLRIHFEAMNIQAYGRTPWTWQDDATQTFTNIHRLYTVGAMLTAVGTEMKSVQERLDSESSQQNAVRVGHHTEHVPFLFLRPSVKSVSTGLAL
jgi:hypothetical protein